MRRLRRIAALTPRELALLIEAVVVLVRIRIALCVCSWPQLVSLTAAVQTAPRPRLNAAQLAWAIRSGSRVVPKATCLTQALALHHVLSTHGYRSMVHVGIAKHHGVIDSHAWVEGPDGMLLGSTEHVGRYSRLFSWPSSQSDRVP